MTSSGKQEYDEWEKWYSNPAMLRYSGNPELWLWEHSPTYEMIAGDVKHGRILDDGGGPGYLAQLLRSGDTYVDLDIASQVLEHAKLNGGKVQGDGSLLPFPENSFNTVLSYLVIRYLPNPRQYLRETHRVLKHGGRLIIIGLRKRWQLTWVKRASFWLGTISQVMRRQIPRNLRALRFPEGNRRFHADHYVYEEHLQAWLERLGFRVVKRTRCGMKIEDITLLREHSPQNTWRGYNMERDGWMFYMVGEKK